MARIRSIWPVLTIATVCLATMAGAQVPSLIQTRDTHARADERRIPIGTSAISGTVTATDTGAPLPGARVQLTGHATCNSASAEEPDLIPIERNVRTDASGQFAFRRLPAGVFRISISPNEDHYLGVEFGQRQIHGRGQSIALANDQSLTIHVPIVRGAVITGRVVGPDGSPSMGIEIVALQPDLRSEFRQIEEVHTTQTDDRGMYRIFGLRPGTYLIAAKPSRHQLADSTGGADDSVETAIMAAAILPAKSGRPQMVSVSASRAGRNAFRLPTGYVPIYAPGVASRSAATAITVAGNEERTGVDIRLQSIPSSVISGVLSTPLDAGVTAQLSLINEDPSAPDWSSNITRLNRDGTFEFSRVMPGNYLVQAQTVEHENGPRFENGQLIMPSKRVLTDAEKMSGLIRVTVGEGDRVVPVSISLEPNRTISGTVVFEKPDQRDLSRSPLTVMASLVDSSPFSYYPAEPLSAVVKPDGRFTITGVPVGRYELKAQNVTLKSAIVSGQDTLDFPLVVLGDRDFPGAVLTVSDSRLGELTGSLTDSAGKPALDYVIVIAATDSRFWGRESRRVRTTEPGPTGWFTVDRLPAGSYQISVVIDPEPGALNDPEYLRTIARTSVQVTIADGAKVTQNLRVK